MSRSLPLSVVAIAVAWCATADAQPKAHSVYPGDPVLHWNEVALQAVADDHSGTYAPAPQQGGPTRASRALAIVHIAIFDAANAVAGAPYEPYLPVGVDAAIVSKASLEAAVARAARDALVALYPAQANVFDAELAKILEGVPVKKGRNEGVAVGAAAAANILGLRGELGGPDDGSRHPLNTNDADAYVPAPVGTPGFHQRDPLNPGQGFHVPGWGLVDTFSGIDVTQAPYRLPPPPALDSPEYAASFAQVGLYGGDGIVTPTIRTEEETEIGLFWAYDGTKGLGVPPRLYNQVVRALAKQEKNTVLENARLFALVNIAQADAGIASWDNKYVYEFWRPVVAIRAGDDDTNDATVGDEVWTPLGAPASNKSGANFTPPFPAYPSGHATFGGAIFRTLEHFYGTDEVSFTLRSDELNPLTTDVEGTRRLMAIRTYSSFTQAAIENGQSRIYLGIHWDFDSTSGIALGQAIADHVFTTLLRPTGE